MDKIIRLLKLPFLFDKALTGFTPSFLMKVVGFLPDPNSQDKRERRLENPADWTASLKPSPSFGDWEYYKILEEGVRPLARNAPYLVARILIDATASMIRLSSHEEGREEIPWERLGHSDRVNLDSRVTLMNTLTFACEIVYAESPESIEVLDQALRNQPWNFFVRLRQHLYSLNLNEQTLPWIRESILKYADFAGVGLDYEFQLMIRRACDNFGANLLSDDEQERILDTILSGPPISTFYLVTGKTGSAGLEGEYLQWQRFCHRKKLRPFAPLLSGKYLVYFQELENELGDRPLTDEDYLPFRTGRAGFILDQSPLSTVELAGLPDMELLKYINEWDEEHRDDDDWLIDINVAGLASEFQALVKQTLTSDEERLHFWLGNRYRIERPVFIKAIVQAIQEHVEERNFERLDTWFEFCEWVLSHPDLGSDKGIQKHEYSRNHPDWGSSRRAVGDFIGACLKEDVNIPLNARSSVARLLTLLCTQFDWRLDSDKPLLLNRTDQITEAINNTRSRALEDLVNFGIWVRRYDSEDSVPEVTKILEERIKTEAQFPLTVPEHAIMGFNFGNVCTLNQNWATEYRTAIFPQDDRPVWMEAFGSFLKFNHPSISVFEILEEEYVFALDHLDLPEATDPSDGEFHDRLGEHLFDYYAWEVFPLRGEISLIERFYAKTAKDRQRWANLFDHVGRSLKRSRKPLEPNLKDRIVAFFDWRINAEELGELQGFTFWLEAECLDPEWRLDAFSRVLDVSQSKEKSISIMSDAFDGMLESHTAKVVKCYAKMTETKDQRAYFPKAQAKSILSAGLNSEEESVRKDAERARENLLNRRYYDLLDL